MPKTHIFSKFTWDINPDAPYATQNAKSYTLKTA